MKKEFKISGLHCMGCVDRINKVLSNIDGIESFEVSLEDKKLTAVVNDEDLVQIIMDKISDLGFEAALVEN